MLSNPLFRPDGGARERPPSPLMSMQLVQFPWSFEETMIECLAERSAFIRAQCECIEDRSTGRGLKIPDELGKRWVKAVMSTPASLRAADDSTIVEYLKAAEFFQDTTMVQRLCVLIGSRLFPPDPECDSPRSAAVPSSSPRISPRISPRLSPRTTPMVSPRITPRPIPCNPDQIAQLVEALPVDLAMRILRSAPGDVERKLSLAPPSLVSLIVLAECPGLSAACMLPSECPNRGDALPRVEFCFDLGRNAQNFSNDAENSDSSPQHRRHDSNDSGSSDASDTRAIPPLDTHMRDTDDDKCSPKHLRRNYVPPLRTFPAAGAAGDQIWVQSDEVSAANVNKGLFSVEKRPSTISCEFVARSRVLQDLRVRLPQGACIVFGADSGAVEMRSVKFQGGAVVCSGSGCKLSLEDCEFTACTLVMLRGAHAALRRPVFRNMHSAAARVSVCASGSTTQVDMHGGSITGGLQGAAILAGARLEATGVVLEQMHVTGIEVHGPGSSAALHNCRMHAFVPHPEAQWAARAVFMHCGAVAHLDDVSMHGMWHGIEVSHGAHVRLARCAASHTCGACMVFSDRGTGELDQCMMEESIGSHGLYVGRAGSRVIASQCEFTRNALRGAVAINGGVLSARSCTSCGNTGEGFAAIDEGSVVELRDCRVAGNYIGCEAGWGGRIHAENVHISDARNQGVGVHNGGDAVMRSCTTSGCVQSGVRVQDVGSALEAHACEFTGNGKGGAFVCRGGAAVVFGCRSVGNSSGGYFAELEAHITISGGTSSHNDAGPSVNVKAGGVISMDSVEVDGLIRSGTLPWARQGRPATY